MRAVVVVPTYQEADNVAVLLRRIRGAAPSVGVIVVDDGSPDGTAAVAEAVGSEVGDVEVLHRTCKMGLGPAYRAGFAHALAGGADILVTMDADLSHDPSVIPMLVKACEEGADLVIGSRYVPGGRIVDWTAARRALSRWGNRYAIWALDLPVNDATSGFRAYRADVVRDSHSGIRASGYGFIIEMAYRLDRKGRKLVEVPITFADRRHGSSKISSRSIGEAVVLVSVWGVRDRIRHRRELRVDLAGEPGGFGGPVLPSALRRTAGNVARSTSSQSDLSSALWFRKAMQRRIMRARSSR